MRWILLGFVAGLALIPTANFAQNAQPAPSAATAKRAPDDLGIFEGRNLMVQSKVTECKAFGSSDHLSEPQCDTSYEFIQRLRFQHGRVFEETLSFKQGGSRPVGSEQTAQADAGTIYLLGQEVDLVRRPDLAAYWRKISGQEIKMLVVAAHRDGQKLTLQAHRVSQANVDTAGQTYLAEIDQLYVGEFELNKNKCKFRPLKGNATFQMHVVKTGFGMGLLLPQEMKGTSVFRSTDTICSVL